EALHSSKPLLVVVGVLFCVAAVYRLGSWGVIDTSEARYSEIPRQMYETGDFLHPVYLGIEHYHKPPLTYHITALSYMVFGPGTFGARIPLQVFLALQMLFIWLIVREIFDDVHKATIGALIYCSFFIVWIAGRNLTTDAYLSTFLLGAIWSVLVYARRAKPVFLYLAAGMAGLAFLTKITASLVILGPVVLAIYWIYRDRWRWSWHILVAGVLYAAVSLSWFLLLEQEGKPVLKYLLYDHSVVRYTTDTFGRNNPFYFYLLAAPVLGFPWLIILCQSVIRQWRNKELQLETGLLFSVWCLFPILFYSVSHSKLILYILPAFAAVAVLTPHHLALLRPRALRAWMTVQLVFYGLLTIGFLTYPLYT
ncbi:MAG: glycosyltransferase family 39 protein, partial [Saprospiraceae bacterium]|nr:glycosyltransferase family 39 protein [Saprospiraceae bacterium]